MRQADRQVARCRDFTNKERVAGCRIIAPRPSNSAHPRRPRRASPAAPWAKQVAQPVPTKQFSGPDEKLRKQRDPYGDANNKGRRHGYCSSVSGTHKHWCFCGPYPGRTTRRL